MAEALRPEPVRCAPTPDGLVIHLAGDIDMNSWPLLDEVLATVLATGPCPVTVDLSAATFADSHTLDLLVRLHEHVTDVGQPFVVASPTRMVARAIEVTGLDRVLTIQP